MMVDEESELNKLLISQGKGEWDEVYKFRGPVGEEERLEPRDEVVKRLRHELMELDEANLLKEE